MMGYDAFEREFGEAVDQSMTLCEFAKTLEERIAAYAADGYSAEELEKLEANTSYLKENKKTLNKCVIFCEPDYMRDFIATNAGYFGDAVVARVGEI